MNNRPSAFAVLAPFLLILIAGFVYYAKYHWARSWVDERYPWIKENIGSRLPSLVVVVDAEGHPVDGNGTAASGGAPAAVADFADSGKTTPPSAELAREYVSSNGAVDLQRLATDRAAWPKTVKLRKPREFPAVVNGKAVGKVEASAGSETRLVAVQAGKLGLEFRGGGAWVAPEDTDIAIRLRPGDPSITRNIQTRNSELGTRKSKNAATSDVVAQGRHVWKTEPPPHLQVTHC